MRVVIYLALTAIIFSSCCIQQKLEATREALAAIRKGQEKENSKLDSVAGMASSRLESGKIDKNIDSLVVKVLNKYKTQLESAKKEATQVESLLTNTELFRKEYKSFVLPALDSLNKINERYDERLKLYLMVEDGLKISNFQLFDIAAFFGPGKYTIPDNKRELALISFAPIVDSMIIFSNKYNSIPRKATLVLLGFADGMGFADEGQLIDTLKGMIGKQEVTNEELNQKLSELRALELSKQLETVFYQKISSFVNFDKLKIEFIRLGKGEVFPLPYIKDYMVDDDRRRIVLCYWAVLPD